MRLSAIARSAAARKARKSFLKNNAAGEGVMGKVIGGRRLDGAPGGGERTPQRVGL